MTNADASHRVEIEPNRHRLRVIHGGITIADTRRGLTVKETGLPDVFYFPREDINMTRLQRSQSKSHCPYKGDASYFHLLTEEDGPVIDAAWSYESPLPGADAIKDCLAFYSSRVDRIDQTS
ncbi:MAG TPA: DUF427 domain-containing protein [Trinickia sp.]|uniref:DUF427 domain-containing protein n=1 Tax=Trinickia sp. TaxID=2571163 RepID=UPI002BC8BD21|nr:DUF427 domain-containing protein [Trinickia sp.]HVW52829.1 DUF427 domain-containing protein [Trinickia sp.]